MENQGIFTVRGKSDGPDITIMSGVHGNEISGILAVVRILSLINIQQLTIKSGKVNFVIANLAAIGQGVRQTQMNLNRAFRKEDTYGQAEMTSYEFRRARELMPILSKSHAMLDLHSSPNPQSTPFIICEPHSNHIAAKLPVGIVSRGWDVIEAGGTDYFVNQNPQNQNYGICIECGFHNDPNAPDKAFRAAMIFLAEFGVIDPYQGCYSDNIPQRHIWAKHIHHTKVNFCLAAQFADFQAIKTGTLIGHDGNEEVRASEDCVIIFPQNKDKPQEEAFILGVDE
jgi:succinylglutamate desuccinylase